MLMVQRLSQGWAVAAVAAAQGVTPKTVRKWRARHAAEGAPGLADRSSKPHHSPTRLLADVAEQIEQLRRQRLSAPAIARRLQRPVSTVGLTLHRRGLGQLSALDQRPPVIRYQRENPGELIHIDIKKLGRIDGIGHRITGDRTGQSNKRGTGWEYVHVAIDDASRLAYIERLPNERKDSAIAFTTRAIDWYGKHGVSIERIMSDNGSAYKSFAFRDLLLTRGIRHKRTRPYTPRTNGKAGRFIQTSLREWAELAKVPRALARGKPVEGYAQPFQTSAEREAAMQPWVSDYNSIRPHSALGGQSPLTWLAAYRVQMMTKASATSNTEPRFDGVAGVKPREATAEGGLGLTPAIPAQAQSGYGWDNVLGNDS